ncbi:hypothetical protein QF035_000196 [Streptomyces umbrinus]|uniref:Uncharacterized protein n=1 Tax=Streptomyces umbrinus TaxID=67370 RepID=A0ABU0SJF7_9ACTN|nr:hypothetical protein [Streptomyces umbrinus]
MIHPPGAYGKLPVHREVRCLLCDRTDEHHGNCAAPYSVRYARTRPPLWVRMLVAEGTKLTPGNVLDVGLHMRETARHLTRTGVSYLRERPLLPETPGCPHCGADTCTAHVPAGRRLYTDLAFIVHQDDCLLREVPAAWIVAAVVAAVPVPADLPNELRPGISLPGLERIAAVGGFFSHLVPPAQRRCALCTGPIGADGSGTGSVKRAALSHIRW